MPAKKTKSISTKSNTKHDPHASPIIQFAVVFIIIAAMALVAYAVKFYL